MNSAEQIVATLLEADPYAQGIKQAFDQVGASTILGAFHSYLAKMVQVANGDTQEEEAKQRAAAFAYSAKRLGVTADGITMHDWLAPIIKQSQFIKQQAPKLKGRSTSTISDNPEFKKWVNDLVAFFKKQYPNTFFSKLAA